MGRILGGHDIIVVCRQGRQHIKQTVVGFALNNDLVGLEGIGLVVETEFALGLFGTVTAYAVELEDGLDVPQEINGFLRREEGCILKQRQDTGQKSYLVSKVGHQLKENS